MLRMMRAVTKAFLRPTILSFGMAMAIAGSALGQSMTAAGGGTFTLVVKSDGSLWSFGSNNNGQLGINSLTTNKTPIQIPGMSNVASVVAGERACDGADLGRQSVCLGRQPLWAGWRLDHDRSQDAVLLSLANITAIAAENSIRWR